MYLEVLKQQEKFGLRFSKLEEVPLLFLDVKILS